MSKAFHRFRLCLLGIAFLTVSTVILRSIALIRAFDAEIGYFAASGPLSTLIYIMVGICLIFAIAFPFFIPKNAIDPTPTAPSTVRLVSSGVTALILLAVSVTLIAHVATLKAPPLLTLLTFLLLLAASGYFLLGFLAQKAPSLAVLLGYAVILGAALLLAVTYFDLDTPMNAPHKTSLHLCLLSVMLYTIYELRVLIGHPLPRVQMAVSGIAFFFCGTMGLSNTVGFLAGSYDSILYLVCDLFCLAFACYVGAHAFATRLTEADGESEGID